MQDEGRNSEALLTIMICQACDWIENTYDSHNFARNNHNAIAVAKDDQGATEILALIDTLQIIDEHLKARICKLKLKSNMILPISNVQALNIGLNSFDPLLPKPVNDPNVTFDVKEYKKIGESIHSNTIHRNGYEFNTSV